MGNGAGCGCGKGSQAKKAAAPINPSTNNKDAADQFEANNNNQHLVQPPHQQQQKQQQQQHHTQPNNHNRQYHDHHRYVCKAVKQQSMILFQELWIEFCITESPTTMYCTRMFKLLLNMLATAPSEPIRASQVMHPT
jgi:hypothetical protein